MLPTNISAFERLAFLLTPAKAGDHAVLVPLLPAVVVINLWVDRRGDERLPPATKGLLGSGSEGAIFQADIRPHKRFAGFMSLLYRFQQFLSVVFSGASHESVLEIDSRGHQCFSPRAEVLSRRFVEPTIASHVVRRA